LGTLLLLGMGYIIIGKPFSLRAGVFGKILIYTLICYECTSFALWIGIALMHLRGHKQTPVPIFVMPALER
jgi:hypothetical protein